MSATQNAVLEKLKEKYGNLTQQALEAVAKKLEAFSTSDFSFLQVVGVSVPSGREDTEDSIIPAVLIDINLGDNGTQYVVDFVQGTAVLVDTVDEDRITHLISDYGLPTYLDNYSIKYDMGNGVAGSFTFPLNVLPIYSVTHQSKFKYDMGNILKVTFEDLSAQETASFDLEQVLSSVKWMNNTFVYPATRDGYIKEHPKFKWDVDGNLTPNSDSDEGLCEDNLLALYHRASKFKDVITEEVGEVSEAMHGITVLKGTNDPQRKATAYAQAMSAYGDLLGDLLVYTLSEAERFDLDIAGILTKILQSQKTKLDDSGNPIYDSEKGKFSKSPNFEDPMFGIVQSFAQSLVPSSTTGAESQNGNHSDLESTVGSEEEQQPQGIPYNGGEANAM